MLEMWNDFGSSIRGLCRRPFYPIVVMSILALGLSASIGVFTYVNGFYRPFPGADADRLVRVFEVGNEDAYQDISYLDFLDYASADGAFEGIAAVQPYYAASVRLETMTEVAFLEAVSGDFFCVLGVEMNIGRGLRATDDRPEADPVAVISHEWWRRSFSGDESAIGRTIYLNYRPFTVVGVASEQFLGSTADFRPDVWIPIAPFEDRYVRWAERSRDRDVPLVHVYGRLRGDVREEQGLAELNTVASGLDDVYPRDRASRRLRLDASTWIDPRSRLAEWSTVRLMLAAAGGLLLLVCANVANLLLSVAVRRQREMSMRAALGASSARLVRLILFENVVLSGIAGGVALLLAGPASARLGAYFARPSVWGANVAREATVDLRVAAFALVISVVTGMVAGLLPAIRSSRWNLLTTLRTDADASPGGPMRIWGRRPPSARDMLVSAQVALSVVLLVVAGLVLRTLVTAGNLDPGFSYDRLVVTHVSTSSTDMMVGDRDRFFRELAERVSEEPWVRSATVADFPLLSPHASADLLLDGRIDTVSLVYSKVLPGFFEALGIEVIEGRSFEQLDTIGSREVAIVNEKVARHFFAGRPPVGRRIRWPNAEGGEDRVFEIVGVVRDTKTEDFFTEPPPTVYFSYPQHSYPSGSALVVSTNADPATSVPHLYRWLRDFEPHLAIVNVVPYTDVVRGFLYTHRMNAEMFSVLASLGVALSAVGIFSIASLAVSRRRREIGIRLAVGAQRRDISRLIVGRALISVGAGIVLGLAVSLGLTGLARSLLYGVRPTDPATLAGGAGVLVVFALAAAYIPARRASAVDPMIALRHD
jgi:predicted permease